MSKILVVGGAGYIGSQTSYALLEAGYEIVIMDNLVYGHLKLVPTGAELVQADLQNPDSLQHLFQMHKFSSVIHFAAYAYVGESVQEPEKYYYNNLVGTLNLLSAMRQAGVKDIVFSSTCATYGTPTQIPIPENHPQNPINPYGRTKLMVEQVLDDYQTAYGINSIRLRYFNAAGADLQGRTGESHNPETHLIPLILDVAAGLKPAITVFGTDYDTPDGTCIRDYIHTMDLAKAHVLAMNYLQTHPSTSMGINLGSSEGFSVLQIIRKVEEITQKPIPIQYGQRRPGDPARLVGDNQLASKLLNWQPTHSDLDTIISSAWQWHQKNHL